MDSSLLFEPLPLVTRSAALKPKHKLVLQRLYLIQRLCERPVSAEELSLALEMKLIHVQRTLDELARVFTWVGVDSVRYPDGKKINWRVCRGRDGLWTIWLNEARDCHPDYNKDAWPASTNKWSDMASDKKMIKEDKKKTTTALDNAFKSLEAK